MRLIRDGSPDTSGKSHSDEREEISDALELREFTRTTFDLDPDCEELQVLLDADLLLALVAVADKSTDKLMGREPMGISLLAWSG